MLVSQRYYSVKEWYPIRLAHAGPNVGGLTAWR